MKAPRRSSLDGFIFGTRRSKFFLPGSSRTESYVRKTRDKAAALRFMKKTLKRHGRVETITTDGRSYKAAMRELGNQDKQESVDGPTIAVSVFRRASGAHLTR
jgi:transposase-like protein